MPKVVLVGAAILAAVIALFMGIHARRMAESVVAAPRDRLEDSERLGRLEDDHRFGSKLCFVFAAFWAIFAIGMAIF